MHLLETYALATGSKIKKPFIFKKYFPLPVSKYITIQNSSGMSGKCYDYFQEVVDFLYEDLQKNGYSIIQIGSKDDKPLDRVINLQGYTNLNQTAFILDNSNLHIGNDSFAIHMCSFFNIPLISLYSISSPEIAGPFWKNNKQICLTPPNWTPSFNPNESPKKVNEITVEKIVDSTKKLLSINNINKIKTVHIGNQYGKILIESFPNQIVPPNLFGTFPLNIRIDYTKEDLKPEDYNAILSNLNIRNCSIITDKPIDLKPLFNFKDKILGIFYDITENINLEFINQANLLGFKIDCIFHENTGNKNLEQRKFDLIDYPQIINVIPKNKLDIELGGETYYKSRKLIIANNKFYLSKTAQEENVEFNIHNNNPWVQKVSDLKNIKNLLEKDSDYSFIFQKISS
jgi:hypothetical protein